MELTKDLETKRLKQNLNNLVDYRNSETSFLIYIYIFGNIQHIEFFIKKL